MPSEDVAWFQFAKPGHNAKLIVYLFTYRGHMFFKLPYVGPFSIEHKTDYVNYLNVIVTILMLSYNPRQNCWEGYHF